MLRIKRIQVYLNDTLTTNFHKWISFGQHWAFSTRVNEDLIIGERYNMTVVLTTPDGQVSKATEFLPCEPYLVEKTHLLY